MTLNQGLLFLVSKRWKKNIDRPWEDSLHSLETPPFRAGASMLYYENRSKDEHVWCTTWTWGSERWDFCRNFSLYKLAKELVCETFLRVAQADISVRYLKDLSCPLLTKPPHTAFYGMHKAISAALHVSQYIFFFLSKGPTCRCSSIQRVRVGGPSGPRHVTLCHLCCHSHLPSLSPSIGVGLVEAGQTLEALHRLGLNNRLCINYLKPGTGPSLVSSMTHLIHWFTSLSQIVLLAAWSETIIKLVWMQFPPRIFKDTIQWGRRGEDGVIQTKAHCQTVNDFPVSVWRIRPCPAGKTWQAS